MTPEIKNFMEQQDHVFFRPTQAYWDYIGQVDWRWRRYVDVGSGMGFLTKAMREKGYAVTAIDKYIRNGVLIDDTIEGCAAGLDPHNKWPFEFEANDVLVFARPCHGAFVGLVLRHHIDAGDALYISKPHNTESDLFGWFYEEVAQNVGEDGESMFRVWGKNGAMKMFHRIGMASWGQSTAWMHYNGRGRYENNAGGWMPADGCTVHETREAQHSGMFKSDFHFDDKSDAGWLAPDGTFYGCHSREHDHVAYDVLRSSVARLERYAFARLYGDYNRTGNPLWTIADGPDGKRPRPTPQQARVLRDKGYDLKQWNDDLPADASFPL